MKVSYNISNTNQFFLKNELLLPKSDIYYFSSTLFLEISYNTSELITCNTVAALFKRTYICLRITYL